MSGEAITKTAGDIDYNGVRYGTCCAGCPEAFKADPAGALKSKRLENKTVGTSLFDPVTGLRIEPKNAKGGSEDYKGIRYYFASEENKKSFDADPKMYAAAAKKEVLYCAVMGHAVKDYASAGGYVTVEETRYYVCCGSCLNVFKEKSKEIAAKVQDKAKVPAAFDAPKSKS
jgi:YHS domain-containing protein